MLDERSKRILSDMMRNAGKPIPASVQDARAKYDRHAAEQLVKELELGPEYVEGTFRLLSKMSEAQRNKYIGDHRTANKVFRSKVDQTAKAQGYHYT